jgi:hypothetical protein
VSVFAVCGSSVEKTINFKCGRMRRAAFLARLHSPNLRSKERSPARRSRNRRRATAILAVLGHGRDARGTRSRGKRKFLVKKTRVYGMAKPTSAFEVCGSYFDSRDQVRGCPCR